MTTGERIRAARKVKGLTQTALALRMGQRQPMIARWEAGVFVPRHENLVRIATALNVELKDILGEEYNVRQPATTDNHSR